MDWRRADFSQWTINQRRLPVKGRGFPGLLPEAPVPLRLTPEDIPLSIIFEDKDLLILDKPAGFGSPPGSGTLFGNPGPCPAFSLSGSFGNRGGTPAGDRPSIG